MKLSIGAIYIAKKFPGPGKKVRLMGYDQASMLYEVLDHRQVWYYENLVARTIYNRLELTYFLNNFEYFEEMPYSAEQLKTYRPDLPCHMLLSKNVDFSWPFPEILKAFDISNLEFQQALPAVYLIPNTRKNSDKTPVLVKAESGGLSLAEILEVAVTLRKEWVPEATDIGIHRSGHKQRTPTFYVAGYYDLGNTISNWEKEKGQDLNWRKALAPNT